ncbi:uncharacterized protein LOC111332174 [Stylophora pistillata]|uniref:uncharacterized protein LOC111332174 n=1 Tax=Stylophora pistillata TaxID=50429 RepID=UPI000C0578AE|nr:uncharacterized protein LOC111332174 [Stylophora pistillata]
MPDTAFSQESGFLYHRDTPCTSKDFRRYRFNKNEFHYLNVPLVGTVTVYDVFDCKFDCLSNPLCFSVNLAASKGAHGKLWCELLSSDKYRNSTEYKGNKSSHHFAIESPCSSSPCQHESTCLTNYKDGSFKCLCAKGYTGEYCDKGIRSCKEVYNLYKSSASQLVTLVLESKPTTVLCQMGDFGCGDGAWTPVMKIDGNKATFRYDSSYWSDKNEYNALGGRTGFDSEETKLPTYWNTPFSKICLGMKISGQLRFIVFNKQANSLHSLTADGTYRATSLGRNEWKKLIGAEGSLQLNCNKEGFNVVGTSSSHSKVRIGYIANQESDCHSCDSRIGFGGGGGPDNSNACGNTAAASPDNGDRYIKAMGYIVVQ